MRALLLFFSLCSITAFAGTFDIDNPKILGQYELAKADKNAEIQEVKIVYNNDGKLVLVRDGDQEYELEKANNKGVIYEGYDEPNCDGAESVCYYDASVVVRLGETLNSKKQTIPQITIVVERVNAFAEDGDSNNEDYTYTVVLNWTAEIEDAVPYYLNIENPAELKAILDKCNNKFKHMLGNGYMSNRVCHEAKSFKIRDGINPQEAFRTLVNDWGKTKTLKKSELEETLFAPSDAFIKKYVEEKSDRKPGADYRKLIIEAKKVRQYIVEKSSLLRYQPEVSSIAWLFALDPKNGMMYRYTIFMHK